MKNKRMLIAATCYAALFAGSVQANSMDPVSQDEINRAKNLATIAPVSSLRLSKRASGTAERSGSSSSGNIEFLRVEAHRFDKADQDNNKRWADATSYDYSTDELITTVINLDNNSVVSTKRHRNMQPPLSQNELTRALNIVLDDPEERRIIDAEFKRITGQTLTSIDQLDYKAFTFFADSMPTVVNSASESCGAQRCAQLMLYTHDNLVFEVSPIVNLSAGVVTQRMGY